MELIKVKHLSKSYNGHIILNDISFSFPSKGIVAIIGESGCGKSTLLKCLMGIEKMDKGEIFFKGKKIKNFQKFRNRYSSFVYQNYNLISFLTPYQNVKLASQIKKVKNCNKLIKELFCKMDLEEKMYQNVDTLSGGEKQRVAFIRALVTNPKILFCDEPTGSLDKKNSNKIIKVLKEIGKDRLVIIVSHDLEQIIKLGASVIKLENHACKEIVNIINNDPFFDDSCQSSISLMNIVSLSMSSLSKNKSKAFLSIICFSMSLLFILFSMNSYLTIQYQLNDRKKDYLNYNLIHFSKETKTKIEGTSFSLVQMNLPSKEDKINISYLVNLNEYRYDLTPSIGQFPNINYPLGSLKIINSIEFVPYSNIMKEKMMDKVEGRFPQSTSFFEVLINKEASKIIKNNMFGLEIEKDIDYKTKDNKIITDSYSIKRNVKIVGIIDEFSLLETPKIYYPIDGLDLLTKEIRLTNLSDFFQTTVSLYDRLTSYTCLNDSFSSKELLLEIKNIEQVENIYINLKKIKLDNNSYYIYNDSIELVLSFKNMFNSLYEVIITFLIITIMISVFLLGLFLHSIVIDIKKDIGIILSMGISYDDIYFLFLNQGIIISNISIIISFITFCFAYKFLNNVFYSLTNLFLLDITYLKNSLVIVIIISISTTLLSSIGSAIAMKKLKINEIIKEE